MALDAEVADFGAILQKTNRTPDIHSIRIGSASNGNIIACIDVCFRTNFGIYLTRAMRRLAKMSAQREARRQLLAAKCGYLKIFARSPARSAVVASNCRHINAARA